MSLFSYHNIINDMLSRHFEMSSTSTIYTFQSFFIQKVHMAYLNVIVFSISLMIG